MSTTHVVEGWFTSGPEPALVGSRCTVCAVVVFPPVSGEVVFCRNPACEGTSVEAVELSRRGSVWSFTDARYQPPPPYVAPAEGHVPFAIAAVRLPEGLVVVGQVAAGYGVADLRVGAEVELVVEVLYTDDTGGDTGGESGGGPVDRTVWRWKPVTELGEEADQ